MAYKIIISPKAQVEIDNAIEFYSLKSSKAPRIFISLLVDTYATLESVDFP